MLHTKYESSGPCGFGEDFFMFFPYRSRGGACIDPRGMVGRIYIEDHYTLLHTKYESSGPCGFGEEDFFLYFSHDAPGAGPFLTPGARLAGFIKKITIHTKYQSSRPYGYGEEDIFYVFPIVSLWELSVAMET